MKYLNQLAKDLLSMLGDLKNFHKRQTYFDRKQKENMNIICTKPLHVTFPLSLRRGGQGVKSILARPPPIFPPFILRTNTGLIP